MENKYKVVFDIVGVENEEARGAATGLFVSAYNEIFVPESNEFLGKLNQVFNEGMMKENPDWKKDYDWCLSSGLDAIAEKMNGIEFFKNVMEFYISKPDMVLMAKIPYMPGSNVGFHLEEES